MFYFMLFFLSTVLQYMPNGSSPGHLAWKLLRVQSVGISKT